MSLQPVEEVPVPRVLTLAAVMLALAGCPAGNSPTATSEPRWMTARVDALTSAAG